MLGLAWFLLLPRELGFLGLAGVVLALAIGYLVSEAVGRAANRKRGPALQVMAAGGVVTSYVARNLLEGSGLVATQDLWGYVIVAVAIVVAVQRLR
jgi:hypothetical protein